MKKIKHRIQHIIEVFSSISWKVNFLQALPFWVASILTGLIAVGYAALFSSAEHFAQMIFHSHKWVIFILTPLCFFVAWYVVQKFGPNARGSGIPQVMAAIELANPKYNHKIDHLLSLRIIITKIVSSLVMVIGGAAIGREGPTIQIAGSVFRIINKWIPESWPKLSRQSYILTGAAAGLAAAFNTPLGGLVFAVEELARIHIRFFRTALFSAVIIAGLTAQGLLGPYLYLGFPFVGNLRFTIFLSVALTAILAGIGGSLMSKLILKILSWRNTFKTTAKTIGFIIFSGLTIALIAYFLNDKVLGSGKDIMTTVLFTENKHEEWHTVLLRIVGPSISFGTGAAGGIFAPALAAGASIGAFIASLFEFLGSNANVLILSGMVGFLTGVTRTPFTSAILVLEMTDRHSVIFHLMLAALLSNIASLLIDKHSFYDHLKKGYLMESKDEKEIAPVDKTE
ncbi:chloride channel protein [Chitinophagaceae bacterium LB-8]|uniref:Chloride channel protein n=1 Tax=Paraflavisolibacter caeni TaxID=2982496 RepID=A0A9X3BHW8_9BACT|nr:chloride channel protein [Paraflavisolibacter caeni]MCU7549293.1 chloride channel protein [Paraflavisolibacter caeni]